MRYLSLYLLPFFLMSCSESTPTTYIADVKLYTPTTSKTETRPLLIVRLDFDNQTFIEEPSVLQRKIFGDQNNELNHYYKEISAGQFQFTPALSAGNVLNGIVTLKMNQDHPNPRTSNTYFDQDVINKLHPIFITALTTISNDGFDFRIYDKDRNSAITPNELVIMFVLAGQEDAYSVNNENGVWAHEWCIENILKVDGVTLLNCDDEGDYAVFGERHGDHDATIGIIAHELGHSAFQLPDLYSGGSTRIGYYGLMSNGSWGQANLSEYAGDTPTHMTPWSKIDTGWYRGENITISDTQELQASGRADYNIIKVPLVNAVDEYFLIENRGTQGYDSGLDVINDAETYYSGGVAIWHIDESIIRNNRESNTINSNPSHKGIDFEEAAGASVDYGNGDPSQNFYHNANVNEFTPYTTPSSNAYDGTSTNISILNISNVSEIMTLNINN